MESLSLKTTSRQMHSLSALRQVGNDKLFSGDGTHYSTVLSKNKQTWINIHNHSVFHSISLNSSINYSYSFNIPYVGPLSIHPHDILFFTPTMSPFSQLTNTLIKYSTVLLLICLFSDCSQYLSVANSYQHWIYRCR